MTVGDDETGTFLVRKCFGCGKELRYAVASADTPLEDIDVPDWNAALHAHLAGEYHRKNRVDYDGQGRR